MSAKIEPALSSEEWAHFRASGVDASYNSMLPEKTIATANDTLSDDDPRKITRGRIEAMRHGGRVIKQAMTAQYGHRDTWGDLPLSYEKYGETLIAMADALESYLPPTDR